MSRCLGSPIGETPSYLRTPKRRLTRSGVEVSVLGMGTAPLGDLYDTLDDAVAIDTINAAHELGITLFDTSPLYGHGLAEHRCGTAIRRMSRHDIVISTKVGRWMDPRTFPANRSGYNGGLPHTAVLDYSYDGTLRSFEQSLLRLGLNHVDILLLHDVDVWTHGAGLIESRFRQAMEGAYRALVRLRAEGVVRAIGVGLNEAEMCERFARAGDFDVMLLAGRYSLLEQPALKSFLPLAIKRGIGVMLGGVFNSGILAVGSRPGARYNYGNPPETIMNRVRQLEAICSTHGVRLGDAALQFPLAHPAILSLVFGAVTRDEVIRNVAALEKPIPAAFWENLKSEGLLRHDTPTPA